MIPLVASVWYAIGENYSKFLKYALGFPIGAIAFIHHHNYMYFLCFATYAIACSFGYGDSNWLTKLLTKGWAITFCGLVMGLASFPIIGYWAILQGVISAVSFLVIHIFDDLNDIKEPWVGLLRGLCGTILLIGR